MAENRSKTDQYLLRMPPGLRGKLQQAADSNARSLNAEMVSRLEVYEAIYANMAEAVVERDKLAAQLEATRDALNEQKAVTAGLQRLLHERSEDAQRDEETIGVIEGKYNELKAQAHYLENLKAELLELSKERQESDRSKNEDHLIIRLPEDLAAKISQAAELMKRTMEDQAIDTLEKSYLPPRHLK